MKLNKQKLRELKKGEVVIDCRKVRDLHKLTLILRNTFKDISMNPSGASNYYTIDFNCYDKPYWKGLSEYYGNKPLVSLDYFFQTSINDINPLPKRDDKILVSNDGETWNERIFLAYIDQTFAPVMVVSKDKEKEYLEGQIISPIPYRLWKPLPKITELTMQEIADKFGIEVENLKIKK